jgi:hypothetical protein
LPEAGGGTNVETCNITLSLTYVTGLRIVCTTYDVNTGMTTSLKYYSENTTNNLELNNIVCNTSIVLLLDNNIYSATMDNTIAELYYMSYGPDDIPGVIAVYSASGDGHISITNSIPSPWD